MKIIYEKDAIDALINLTDIWVNNLPTLIYKTDAQSAIEALPSAQPEIIRCKDCKYFERDIKRSWGTYNGCGVWTDDGNEIEVNQYDFCSYAERRTDDSISD